MLEIFGRAEKLHAALRRRIPQAATSLTTDTDDGLPYVTVSYRHQGPWTVHWDSSAYAWRTGPRTGEQLGVDPEQVADSIGSALDAALVPQEGP